MRCHQCNQDSVKVVTEDSDTYIRCDICNLNIMCINPEVSDLFRYNEELEQAERSGGIAYGRGESLKDNPYNINSDDIILYKRWEYGYKLEKESYELSAISLSAEKIQNELKKVQAQKEELEQKIDTFLSVNYVRVKVFCNKLLSIKILGKLLGKKVGEFKKEYREFYQDSWDYPDL